MSKDNHSSRIPMRGFSSRIPMPGATSACTTQSKMTTSTSSISSNQIKAKLTRPTDIGGPLSSFVTRPSSVTQKLTQITKSSLTNLTSRIMTRQFSTSSSNQEIQLQKVEVSSQNKANRDDPDDQMLIDETIDLVGSDDNVNRYNSRESIQSHLPTFDLCRRDGTFIKSPTRGLAASPSIGSVNSLPDTKDKPKNPQRAVSKSRDSLNSIVSNQTRIARLRKSGNDLLGSSLSLTKSPVWGSEDMLTVSPIDNENVNFVNSQLTCGTYFQQLPMELAKNQEQSAMDVDECDAHRIDAQKRFSFGLDITECTLDCSIELCDMSVSSQMQKASPTDKQGSFDVDESLGILTPDQMKEFLDSTNTNHTNNLELPLIPGHKLSYQCRVDQTPSPEELPLDPVGVKMEEILTLQSQQPVSTSTSMHQEISQTESDPKTEMTKSVTSKVSTSIITSITSITSLDTGYIGDGEMSRPASRGAIDQSPSKVQINPPPLANNWNQAEQAAPIHRQRQDPMTDSDFFTESDADDIFHQRENQRRAQVIDGQLYGPMLQGANVIFQQQPQHQNESDSCMESSGIFTDVENRGDDDLLNRIAENRENLHQHANDMSPDLSSDTITSSGTAYSQKKLNMTTTTTTTPSPTQQIDRPREFINETSSSICSVMDERAVSAETINLINDTSAFGSTKSCCMTNDDCDKQLMISDGSSCTKKVAASNSKKLNGSSRKTFKNESNFGLKKHEMTTRCVSIKLNSSCSNDKMIGKKCMNGKWEPVMNKIAENKNVKKKFDNVKSKVTSGAVKRTTSSVLKTPPSDDHSIVSTESTGAVAKINSFGVNSGSVKDSPTGSKRGRAHSKDSHQSSASDISMNGTAASPKIIKTSTPRSAKKRDVRTISSSPSDLGPPSKTSNGTNQTQRSNARNVANSQKRAQPQQIIQPQAVNQIAELKGSPPAKKILPRRLINASPLPQDKSQSPLKDHNRLSQQQSPVNGSPRSSLRSNHSSKAATPPPNSRNGIIDSLNVLAKGKVKELENNNSSKIVNKNSANVNSKMQQEQLLQQIIDKQALEKQKQMLELLHANKSVEALGVLVQYLVFNLDAFSCPSVKKSQQKTQKQLLKAHDFIDEMKSSYQSLEYKLNEREECFSKRELELQELHRCEMANAKKSLEDLENEKKLQDLENGKKLECLRDEMKMTNEENIRKLSKYAEEKLKFRDKELDKVKNHENDLIKRIQKLTITENELRDKVHSSELEFSEKLQHATMKERDLSDKINELTKVLDNIKLKSDEEKRELEEKLNLTQDELSIIRSSRSFCTNESFQNKTLNTSWQDEVESLRCVLELKQHEISELRKTNCELQRAAEDAVSAQIKCSAFESRVEDLQVQLHAKNEEEKELLQKLKTLQEQFDLIQKKSSRLSLHNEELQWRLKQNAERYSMTLNELSKSYHESSSFMCNRSNSTFNEFDASARGNVEDEDTANNSPPTSPIIKGVVEKSDSVSWVLEMDDETPEVLANRMVRRAGSFRSDKCSPSPVPKKQKCQNNSCIQQSASATSIIRQNSEPSPQKTINGRIRSKSVSASKAAEPRGKMIPQIVRSVSGNGAVIKNLSESTWKHHNMKTSSPNPKKVSIEETMGDDLIIDEDFETASAKNDFFLDETAPVVNTRESFHRDSAPHFKKSRENRGLITCDTAALTASGTEIKKQHRRPKASAGEIKFSASGSNSEEEEDEEQSNSSSSASSTVSTGPSTPSISSTSSSSNQEPIESIEDALLRWKEHNNTPMEVSWCEGEPTESCV